MPFTLLQVGGSLKSVNTDGGLSSALTLPSGVTLATNRQPRFARFNRYVAVVNTPSRPLIVGVDGTVYPMTPTAPSTAVALSAGAAGSLSGTYLSLQTYEILDSLGNVITSSDYGPSMTAAFTVTAQKLHAAFSVSAESLVNNNRLFRTTTNGATYFPWASTGNNTSTSVENDTSDASLGEVEAGALGPAPDLTLIAEFGGRFWGVDRDAIDDLRYTEAGKLYAWSALNTLKIPHVGADDAGITALIPRRAALGVARRDVFNQVTGTQRTNIQPTIVNGGEQTGCVSQESVVVFNDVAYFLSRDGVYKWDSDGIKCITNGRVRSWFAKDGYFNRSMFWRAFAQLDPIAMEYRLFLASRGSAVIDRWVAYNLLTDSWYGPHLTSVFSPTCAIHVAGRNQQPFFMIGSQEGFLSQDQEARNDWGIAGIALDVQSTDFDANPDLDKYYGELSVMGKAQAAGTLTVTPSLGESGSEVAQTPFDAPLTASRSRLGRIGVGKSMELEFQNDVINQDVALFGFEVDPVTVVGKR